jgi:hypothetical protein
VTFSYFRGQNIVRTTYVSYSVRQNPAKNLLSHSLHTMDEESLVEGALELHINTSLHQVTGCLSLHPAFSRVLGFVASAAIEISSVTVNSAPAFYSRTDDPTGRKFHHFSSRSETAQILVGLTTLPASAQRIHLVIIYRITQHDPSIICLPNLVFSPNNCRMR